MLPEPYNKIMSSLGTLVLILLVIGAIVLWMGVVSEEQEAVTFCKAYGKVAPGTCMKNYKYYMSLNASNHSKYDINETENNSIGE